MIVPMEKYSFVIYHKAYTSFLDDLQELGVVHIDVGKAKVQPGEEEELRAEADRINKTSELLKFYQHAETEPSTVSWTSDELISQTASLTKKLEAEKQKLAGLQEAKMDGEAWGDYSSRLVDELREAGISVDFYSISPKKFHQEWLNDYPLEIVYQDSRTIKFVVVGESEKIFIGSQREYPPAKQLTKLQEELEAQNTEVAQIEEQLKAMAKSGWEVLQKRLKTIHVRLDWLQVCHNPAAQVGEGTIQVLEGWVPVTDEEKLIKYLEDNHILYEKSLGTAEEKPPIKLHNNKFANLFEPISKLFSLPAYEELDLTIYFAPFFMLFFGFCLGDAGYGVVLLIGSTVYKRFASSSMKPFLSLGQLFGLSTLIMGLIFGTFFGLQLVKVPAMNSVKHLFLDSSQVFNLSLIVGAVQITFGIIIRMKNQMRQAYPLQALSSAGWLLLFATAGWFSFLWKDTELSTLWTIVEKGLYVISIAMILLFSTEGPIHMRILGGIWEMYGTVTGIFGDLLSYIRLFALGIASSILGLVINQMAVAFGHAPYIGPVVFILIILIGHTGNLAISSLGAFVHPMRLTFVEFYKNAGFKGGGKPYTPFSK